MSRGTRVQGVRIPPELMEEIAETVARRNFWTRQPPWTLTGFIIQCIREKIDLMERNRTWRKRRKAVAHAK